MYKLSRERLSMLSPKYDFDVDKSEGNESGLIRTLMLKDFLYVDLWMGNNYEDIKCRNIFK